MLLLLSVSLAQSDRKERLSNKEKFILFGLGNDGNNDVMSSMEERKEKSLLNTFPFIQQKNSDHAHDHDHHQHHGNHGDHAEHQNHGNIERLPFREQFSSRNSGNLNSHRNTLFPFKSVLRQNDPEDIQDEEESGAETVDTIPDKDVKEITALDFNAVGEAAAEDEDVASGRKCIDKVIMTEETVYDEVITCDHSYDKRCHTSYITNYESQQEEECEENFKKSCYIDYEPLAYNETVEVCRTPVVKDCGKEGPTICQTVYESECWTKQNVHEVEDDVTNCQTVLEQKCKEVTVGYTTKDECDEWPVEKCTVEKKLVKKVTPETGCHKEPVELCAPKGCGFTNV